MESRRVLFVLASPAQGIKSEAALRAAGITGVLTSIPRSVSSECGVCLRVPVGERARAEEVLASTGIKISAIHEIDAPATQAGARKETQ
jgi:hypothetical protein